MNQFETYTQKQFSGGFKAFLRTSMDGEAKPILGVGGKPQIFPTRESALEALNKHLVRYVNGHLHRFGEVAGAEMAKAEGAFKESVRQKGKTRTISVTYKGRAKRCAKKKP